MQSPGAKRVEFIVLRITDMSFLGFNKFWDTSECGEERKDTLQTRPVACSDVYQPAVAHSCDVYQPVTALLTVKRLV